MLTYYYLLYRKILNYYTKIQMFYKIQKFFTKKTEDNLPKLNDQFPHPNITTGDPTQCPFMSKKQKTYEQKAQKCPMSGKNANNQNKDSDSDEQQKPKGGCPFMGGSDKKKNPNLNLNQEALNEPFVSKFKYYLSASKIDFSRFKKGMSKTISREVFDNYPIYLQHTLFFYGQDYKKVRNLECCSRFMAYDELRERGNKKYNKGKYYQALDYYQRAMSLFRWLQYNQPQPENKSLAQSVIVSEKSIQEASDNGSKINIQIGQNDKKKVEDAMSSFDELKSQYKEFFVTYDDQNTKLFDGQEMIETPDIDMRKSLLVQIYLNMAAAYIKTHHYYLAQKVCNDGLQLTDKVSQLYFRKAQAISLRKDSSIQKMALAQELINKALEMRPHQKIFNTANQNILKMLNLHNSAEAYQECSQFINIKITDLEKTNKSRYDMVYERAKQIYQIEQSIISQGRTPQENFSDKIFYNTTQMKILDRISKKYVRVMQFYTEAKNLQQLLLAKKEFQEVLRIQHQVHSIFSLNLKQKQGQLGGIQSEKIQRRIQHIKTSFAQNIYNQGRYNFTMLEWVIKEIVKEEAEQEKKRQEQEKLKKANEQGENNIVAEKGYSKLIYLLLIIPLAFILFNFFVV